MWILQSSHGMVNCSYPGFIRDIRCRDFQKGTCRAIDRGSTESQTGGSTDTNLHFLRQTRRVFLNPYKISGARICYLEEFLNPKMAAINFNDDSGTECGKWRKNMMKTNVGCKISDRTNGKKNKNPLIVKAYQKARKETEDWNDFEKLPEKISEYPLIRRLLLGADSVVQSPPNWARKKLMRDGRDILSLCQWIFVRNAAVMQDTHCYTYLEEWTKRRLSNAATHETGSGTSGLSWNNRPSWG